MKPQVLTVRRIIEADTAIDIAGNVDYLDGKVAYRLGRFKKQCEPIVRAQQIARTKENNRHAIELNSKDTSSKRKKEIVDKVNQNMEIILNLEEEIVIPEFNLSDFIAKTDRTVKIALGEGKSENRDVKEGQMLMPQAFFNLMGDLIKDDRSTGEYTVETKKKSAIEAYLEKEEKLLQEAEPEVLQPNIQ
jgi:hypothetical protein